MKNRIKVGLLSLLIITISKAVIAEPWFTGPIIASFGKTIPSGHTNIEIYAFYIDNIGIYNNNWKSTSLSGNINSVGLAFISHGLTNFLDVQFALPYSYNRFKHRHSNHLNDTSIELGIQLLKQNESKWLPNIRLAIQQIFPNGNFRELNPLLDGSDATGLGSYQTKFTFNFQHLIHLSELHYLRTRLALSYTYAANAELRGVSAYGGRMDTLGGIQPGNLKSFNLAEELTLTQNWVAVMEAYLVQRQATHFHGNPGTNPNGSLAQVGSAALAQITLAPAIEYNFSDNMGLIAGPWFSVKGKNSFQFISYVIALNYYC